MSDKRLALKKLRCRGLGPGAPKVWEAWGCATGVAAVDVSFELPRAPWNPDGQPGATMTVFTSENKEFAEWLGCAEGEQVWVARFFDEEHPLLGHLKTWLEADATRSVTVHASEPGDSTATASQAFRGADIEPGREFALGVLLVHGIGPRRQGDTLIDLAEPVIAFLERWLGHIGDRQSRVYEADAAKQWVANALKGSLARQQDQDDILEEVLQFQKEARQPGPKRDKAQAQKEMATDMVLGRATVLDTVLRIDPADPASAGSTLLRLSNMDSRGALNQTEMVFTEAYWTEEVVAPTQIQLWQWIWEAMPLISSAQAVSAWRMRRRELKRDKVGSPLALATGLFMAACFHLLVRVPLALLRCVLAQVVLTLLGAVGLLPIKWLRSASRALVKLMMDTTGHSHAMVSGSLRRSAIVSRAARRLDWLQQRCERILVLAHSQGGEVARAMIRRRPKGVVDALVTFGSGAKLLSMLADERAAAQRDRAQAGGSGPKRQAPRYQACALAALAALSVAIVLAWAGLIAAPWCAALAFVALVGVGLVFAIGPIDSTSFRASVPLTDYYASRDPVPCGPLASDEAVLKKHGFETIEVHNRGSAVFDHTTYTQNCEQFVAPVALQIARLAGMPLDEIVVGDKERLALAHARRRQLILSKQHIGHWLSFAAVLAVGMPLLLHWASLHRAATDAITLLWKLDWKKALPPLDSLPAILEATVPLAAVMVVYLYERFALAARLRDSAHALIERRAPSAGWPLGARLGVYAFAAFTLLLWLKRDGRGATLLKLLTP